MTRLDDLEKKALAKRDGRERIKDLLFAKSLTVTAAATRMGERHDTLTRILGGERSPRAARIRAKLAKLLALPRTDIDQLIDGNHT